MPRKKRLCLPPQSPTLAGEPHLRWMIRRDMPEVLAMETAAFGQDAWVEEEFYEILRKRNCIGMVAERGETLVGFMVYELHKCKLELLNFAVHPDRRRERVGHAMVSKLISKLSSHRRTRLDACVAERNVPAQSFFRAMGFKATGVLRDWFDGQDAIAFTYQLDKAPDPYAEMQAINNRIAHLYGSDGECA